MKMLFYLVVLTCAYAQTAQVTFTVYGASSGGTCSTAETGTINSTFSVGQCTATAVTAIGIVRPTAISSTTIIVSQYDQADLFCTGTVVSTRTMTNSQCFGRTTGGDLRPAWTVGGGGGGGSSSSCFHESTRITYAGKEYSLHELGDTLASVCAIPHIVQATGVTITTQCGGNALRLTDGHLVYTQRGLVPASQLRPGQDTLYTDVAETRPCAVQSVTQDKEEQRYFGLNCLESQVLANGIKTSTFEKLHWLPAMWMRVAGSLLGIQRASAAGDALANVAQKMRLI